MTEEINRSRNSAEMENELGKGALIPTSAPIEAPQLVFPNRTKCPSCGAGPGFFSTGLCSRVECPCIADAKGLEPNGCESSTGPVGQRGGDTGATSSPFSVVWHDCDYTDDQVVTVIAGATELPVADVQRVIDQLGTWEELGRFARVN